MLRLEGARPINLPPETVWPKLRDASFLVQCIPDATVTGTPTQDQAACTVRPGVSFVRGSLDVVLEIAEAIEGKSLRWLQTSKGIGSSAEVESRLGVEASGSGALITWIAEITRLGGLLKAVPTGLIRGAAHKVIEDVWQGIEKKLKEGYH